MRIWYQFNLAQMKAPYDDPLWDSWKKIVPRVHASLDGVDGFLGYLDGTQTEAGYLRPYPDRPLVMGNLSAWSSEMALHHWVHSGAHGALLKKRAEWFHPWPNGDIYSVIWVDHDRAPKFRLDYATAMLELIRKHGPDPQAGLYGFRPEDPRPRP